MNTKLIAGDKPETVFLRVKNAESSSSIAQGNAVVLVMNATDDGLAVVLPATAAATKTGTLGYGVATGAITAGSLGDVQVFGFCRNAVVVKRTRSATDAVWASTAAMSVGQALTIDTVDNCLRPVLVQTGAVFTGAATTDTAAAPFNLFIPYACLAETVASQTTSTSATSYVVGTVSTGLVKVFLRML